MPQQKLKLEVISHKQQPELVELTPNIQKAKKDKENLEQIVLTQQQLTKIKDDLNKLIDAMADNPSFLARTATLWGELALWKKIVAEIF